MRPIAAEPLQLRHKIRAVNIIHRQQRQPGLAPRRVARHVCDHVFDCSGERVLRNCAALLLHGAVEFGEASGIVRRVCQRAEDGGGRTAGDLKSNINKKIEEEKITNEQESNAGRHVSEALSKTKQEG